jgi:GxxExxY protein
MIDLIQNEESFQIIGVCMEVHNQLGSGFSEIVYKDAIELEFHERNIPFEREQKFNVNYKGAILPHSFYADFVVFETVILEVKAVSELSESFYGQTINYLKVSGNQLALIMNFGQNRLDYKRVVY